MDAITQLLSLDVTALFTGALITLFGVKAVASILEWSFTKCGLEFTWMRRKREERQLLASTSARLLSLENQRLADVEESRKHDMAIREDLSKVADAVEKINSKLDEMEAKNDASEMAKLKDRIAQSYRHHSASRRWSRMEEETFRGLITDYEAHGGKNSFVHSICEAESYTWEIID